MTRTRMWVALRGSLAASSGTLKPLLPALCVATSDRYDPSGRACRTGSLSGWHRKFVGGVHAACGSGLSWGSSCWSWRLMRSMRSCRSLVVNFQLNGLAVWL